MHGEVSFSVQIVAIRHHPQSGWLDEGPQRGSTQLSHGDLFSSDHDGSLKGGFYSIAVHGSTNTRKTLASSRDRWTARRQWPSPRRTHYGIASAAVSDTSGYA